MAQPVGEMAPPRQGVGVEPGRPERGKDASPIGEDHDQREAEPESRQREQRHRRDGQRGIEPWAGARLEGADGEAEQIGQDQRQPGELERRGYGVTQQVAHAATRRDAAPPIAACEPAEPGGELRGQGPVEAQGVALQRGLFGRGGGSDQLFHRVAGREP